MSRLAYRTISGAYPKGKPRVYFACHPDDLPAFLEQYARKILRIRDCAIWYETEYDAPCDENELEAVLAGMQLIVMPVTEKLLTEPNRAMDTEFPAAQKAHVPVLPILLERGLGELFTQRFGDLQYLDPDDPDPSRRSFDEVLAAYIRTVLVGDELAAKVRAAFDACIFLSYRKKDRVKAQKLMRLIHKNPLCRDIAIWYDEFLTPGEDFNQAIRAMLEKSDLFTLAVTPNLVNERNYIMTTEYPAAKESGKAILPVEMEETDREALRRLYDGIPDCVESHDEAALLTGLLENLHRAAVSGQDAGPEHCFLIGLAYLEGIDVEVDHGRALRLIRTAGEAGLPEALEELSVMYETGKGVARDYRESIAWRKRQAEALRKQYEETREETAGTEYFTCLWRLGDLCFDEGLLSEAEEAYRNMLSLCEEAGDRASGRDLSVSWNKLGSIAGEQGRLEEAKAYYRKGMELRYARAASEGSPESFCDLAISYGLIGGIAEAQGRPGEAETFYNLRLQVVLAWDEAARSPVSRRELAVCYELLGNTAAALHRPQEAKRFYEKSLELRRELAEETGSAGHRRDLMVSWYKLGQFAQSEGRTEHAEECFRKAKELGLRLAEETGSRQSIRDLKALCPDPGRRSSGAR